VLNFRREAATFRGAYRYPGPALSQAHSTNPARPRNQPREDHSIPGRRYRRGSGLFHASWCPQGAWQLCRKFCSGSYEGAV